MPPMAGPMVSGVSRCPSQMPSAANGTRTSAVMPSQRPAGSRTPIPMPAAYSSTMLSAAIRYPLSTLARRYCRIDSGVSRSCRFQPVARSAAIRAPLATTAAIVPQLIMPAM